MKPAWLSICIFARNEGLDQDDSNNDNDDDDDDDDKADDNNGIT